jgi:transposase
MSDGHVEILTGRERRRRWSAEAKLRIVAETEEPGGCVKQVAARHDVYPGLLFTWCRQVSEGRLTRPQVPMFIPVETERQCRRRHRHHPHRRPEQLLLPWVASRSNLETAAVCVWMTE